MTDKRVDWNELHRRLDAVRVALDSEFGTGEGERSRILKARARALALEPETSEIGETLEVVEFLLAHEQYAIASTWVREVVVLRELTPLPGTPPFILGLVNVRGQILTVVDIKKFFDLPEKGLSDLNKIIILHTENIEFGILADAIVGVRAVALDQLQPPPAGFTGIRTDYLKGLTPMREIVLDGEKLLMNEKLLIRDDGA